MDNSAPVPPIPQQTTASTPKWLKVVTGVALGIFIGLILGILFRPAAQTYTTISGTIQYNGMRPVASAKGKIVILQKELNAGGDYEIASDNIPVSRGAPWSWYQALENKTYQIKAQMQVEGVVISESSTITVTAPAIDQVLEFNVTRVAMVSKNIPPSEVVAYNNATIAGTLDLNGYIPSGSTVRVIGRSTDQPDYHLVSNVIPAEDGRELSWEAAQPGEIYDFIGLLADANGHEIGRSAIDEVAAPSEGNILPIQSQVTPPVQNQKAVISGKIQLNGIAPSGSVISMRQKLSSQNDFSEFSQLEAINGVEWSWGDANAGQVYDITAVLEINGVDEAMGQVLSLTAPANSETLVLNTGYSEVLATATPEPSREPTSEPSPNPSGSPIPTLTPTSTPLPTATPTPKPTPPGQASSCSVNYVITNETSDTFSADVTVMNTSGATVAGGWNLTWDFRGQQVIVDMWNASFTQDDKRVAITGQGEMVANGGATDLGFNGTYKGANNSPTNYNLNGNSCISVSTF